MDLYILQSQPNNNFIVAQSFYEGGTHLIIAVEGIHGSGKTTFINNLELFF